MREESQEQTTDLSDLKEKFTKKEIKATVWNLGADKSPIPDDFAIVSFNHSKNHKRKPDKANEGDQERHGVIGSTQLLLHYINS